MQRSVDYREPFPIGYICNTTLSIQQLKLGEDQGRGDGKIGSAKGPGSPGNIVSPRNDSIAISVIPQEYGCLDKT